VNPLDWGILGAGLLAFVFSFTPYYKYSAHLGGPFGTISGTDNAWHGFFGWFAMLCAVVGSAIVASELFGTSGRLPFAARLGGLVAYAVASLCVILAIFVIPGDTRGTGIDKGHSYGFWISLVVILAGLVLSLMRFQQRGGQLPGALSKLPNIGGGPTAR